MAGLHNQCLIYNILYYIFHITLKLSMLRGTKVSHPRFNTTNTIYLYLSKLLLNKANHAVITLITIIFDTHAIVANLLSTTPHHDYHHHDADRKVTPYKLLPAVQLAEAQVQNFIFLHPISKCVDDRVKILHTAFICDDHFMMVLTLYYPHSFYYHWL